MKNIVYYIAIATVLLFASCASELDTEPSGSQVSDEQLSEQEHRSYCDVIYYVFHTLISRLL